MQRNPQQLANNTVPLTAQQSAYKTAASAQHELVQAIVGAHKPLFTTRTVFPFTLFPDTIVVDRTKLTVTQRSFFWTAEVMSIRIEDILNVTADVGPLFGSVKIATRFFNADKPYAVNYLWRSDALKIKRLVQGCLIATKSGIDYSTLESEQLAALLDELGNAGPGESV